MRSSAAALAPLACLFFVGCQTPKHVEFTRIKEGMVKGDVVEAAGNPSRTQRWQGKDRWIYELYPDGVHADIREVHFTEGRVTYIGTPTVPEVSAEEQDRLNAESNIAEEKRLETEKAAAAAAKANAADVLSGQSRPQPTGPGGAD
ncbi:MAG: hypothetical protein NDI61_12090 [Bdellovibrionaceae bacterium]|nr:hypothetical protein [Pseudobdellovibrionaceae bacterium]